MIKKTLLGLALSLAVFTTSQTNFIEQVGETRASTIVFEQEIAFKTRQIVSQSLIAPFKTMDYFVSEVQKPGFEFTSVGGKWQKIAPNGTNVESFVRFNIDNSWTDWLDLEEEEDLLQDDQEGEDIYAMASSNPATAMQYKFELYGDGINTPLIRNPEWTFINTSATAELKAVPQPKIAASSNGKVSIISRNTWGANESYRYLEDNNTDPVLIEISESYIQKYANELKYSRVIEKDGQGNKYKWPEQYPERIKKFVVHHTATTGNLDNPKQAIRDIYYYHAVTRGWGDIGYNYLIDQQGKVYEGRAGGEGVIGAHAGGGNNGSVGIAILGNYEENSVPEKVIGAISDLIGAKAKLQGVDPEGKSIFRGQRMDNVIGHKDLMSTTCPGANLYNKLPVIRALAASYKAKEVEKFVKDYAYIDHSDLSFLEMKPEETTEVTVRLENIGKKDWNNKTFLVVDKNPTLDKLVKFPESSGLTLAKMVESETKSGKYATFKFKIQSTKIADLAHMKIAPMINGSIKGKTYVDLPVSVEQVDYRYKLVDQKFPPEKMEPAEIFSGWVKLRNTGNVTWKKAGTNSVTLRTDHERDHRSELTSPPSNVFGVLQEEQVLPGEVGTFQITIKAPEEVGYYKEYFTPVVGGITWMADSGMSLEVTVAGELYAAEVIETFASEKWEQGGKYLVQLTLRNMGEEAWNEDNFQVVFMKEKDLNITRAKLIGGPVTTGQIGTITFVAEVDPNEKLNRKPLLIKPRVNSTYLFKRPIRLYYTVIEGKGRKVDQSSNATVVPSSAPSTSAPITSAPSASGVSRSSTSTNDPDIRVKLSFEGNPQITANGSFEIYSGSQLLEALSSGQSATVEKSGSKYKVKTEKTTYTKSEEIRFVPKNVAILQIANYEKRPAWNTALNDNQFRGALEVRSVDGKLTVINDLKLEDYLKGLGEVSNSELTEKIKAIIIAARTYAKFYISDAEKFPGKPYNLDDDPNVSQKYIGYGFELRAPNITKAVEATKGEVVTYNGSLVKTPYFNQTDGTKTKSAQEVWGWTTTPYLISVVDTYCNGSKFLGHGVGLSGCGAHGMAAQGSSYAEILKHYYSGVEITDLY